MGLTPEQFENLLKALNTQEGTHDSILVFTGILTIVGIIAVVWLMLNVRLQPFIKLESRMDALQDTLNSISAKLWTPQVFDSMMTNKINQEMKEHMKDCPARKRCTGRIF